MLRDQVILFSALPAGDQVPEWLHLLPAGTFSGADGRGPFTLGDAAAVITASMAAGKIPLDENHSTDRAAPQGRPSPARGWIVEMQLRDDGIWGRVEWTKAGHQLMADKEYRGISPVIVSEKQTGRVVQLLRASLVNDPNLKLTTLHDRSQDDMIFIDQVRAALGLGADVSEAAVLAAIGTNKTQLETHSAAVKAIAKAAGQAETTEPGALATQVSLHYQGADQTEADLRKTVTTLQAQVTTLQQDGQRATAVAYVDGAIKAGKPIKPLRDRYITRHMADPAGVESEIDALPSIHSGGIVPKPKEGGGTELSDLDKRICDLMSVDAAEFAKTAEGLAKESV